MKVSKSFWRSRGTTACNDWPGGTQEVMFEMNSGEQWHSRSPSVLTHCWLQPPLFSSHSSTSRIINTQNDHLSSGLSKNITETVRIFDMASTYTRFSIFVNLIPWATSTDSTRGQGHTLMLTVVWNACTFCKTYHYISL